jgi:ABC-type sugar transport system ATPase subunit
VFLLDEPLSNLDAHLRVQMRTEILKVHRTVTATAVYVTHDQVEAMTMGDRIAVMSDGVIQQLGTPDELYDRPTNRFVGGFIGTPAMGFLPCERTGEHELQGAGVRLRVSPAHAAALPSGQTSFVAGIRPEHLEPVGDDRAESTVEGAVELVEPLGSEQHVVVNVADETITAKLARHYRFDHDDKVVFAVDPVNLHVFDPESGIAYR